MTNATPNYAPYLVVVITLLSGCKPDEPIVVPTSDCSSEHTVTVENADTILQFNCISTFILDSFTTGIRVTDFAVNPLNRNQFCIAIIRQLESTGSKTSELWVYDQCKNTASMIESSYPDHSSWSNDLICGLNARIMYYSTGVWRSVLPNGSDAITIPNLGPVPPIVLETGNLLMEDYINGVFSLVEYTASGNPVDTNENFLHTIDITPDGKLFGISRMDSSICLFDRSTEVLTVMRRAARSTADQVSRHSMLL